MQKGRLIHSTPPLRHDAAQASLARHRHRRPSARDRPGSLAEPGRNRGAAVGYLDVDRIGLDDDARVVLGLAVGDRLVELGPSSMMRASAMSTVQPPSGSRKTTSPSVQPVGGDGLGGPDLAALNMAFSSTLRGKRRERRRLGGNRARGDHFADDEEHRPGQFRSGGNARELV